MPRTFDRDYHRPRHAAMQQQLQPILNQLVTLQQQMMALSQPGTQIGPPAGGTQGAPNPYDSQRDLQAAASSIDQATTLIRGVLSKPGV